MQVLQNDVDKYIISMRREINPSRSYEILTRKTIEKLNGDYSQDNIEQFFDSIRKTNLEDPLHKWIGTYNLYRVILKRFLKWLGNPYLLESVKQLKRKEKSIYKPSDIWTPEDDLIFLKYCPSKRDRCYHAMARDSSCRPSELLRLQIKDVVFKSSDGVQYAEILVNGKTGTRHIPLINSIPYLKDYLLHHPARNNPNLPLICTESGFRHITNWYLNNIYANYKKVYFPSLVNDPRISPEYKRKISDLLKKPWNPYILRHSALTDKSKLLKEHILRQHAGWSIGSKMPEKYLHYFGNESSESILEAYGLKPKQENVNKLKPVTCPNCGELNAIDSKFCMKCRMVLTYDAWEEVSKPMNMDLLKEIGERLAKLEQAH